MLPADLDAVVATAPATLRKGPRGGGRDRDEVLRHVLAAETSYARQPGLRMHEPAADDETAVRENRDAILATLKAGPSDRAKWPLPYACGRMAWHVRMGDR